MSDEEFYSSDSEKDSDVESVISEKKEEIENIAEPDDADISDEEIDENSIVDESEIGSEPEEEEDDSDVEAEEEEEEEVEEVEEKQAPNKSIKKKSQKKQLMILDDDDDNEDEEYNDNYMEKFNADLVKNYVEEFHPECVSHNYDEITKLTHIVRNSEGIVIDPLHKTIPYLTKYERARILGQRAKQIETGSKPFVKVPENIIDGYIIAELELKEKKIPFIIKRPIPGGGCEYWNLKDLEMIHF
jgi:DNA-directed RNA polymerase I, II, and III subunit RPABC2